MNNTDCADCLGKLGFCIGCHLTRCFTDTKKPEATESFGLAGQGKPQGVNTGLSVKALNASSLTLASGSFFTFSQ